MAFGIPVYNQSRENLLEAAVDSILAQTWRDFRVVIVDDASTDDTWDVVQKIAHKDSRITAYRNPSRLGSIRNFRRCFELAQPCDLFAWVSQHDLHEPDWLRVMIEAIREDDRVVLAYPFADKLGVEGEKLALPFQEFDTTGLDTRERVLKTIWARAGAGSMVYGLFRAKALKLCGVYRDVLFPDVQLLIELAFFGTVRQVPRVLWHRRMDHSYSLSRQRHTGFTYPPWYAGYSVQVVNSVCLLWHRCLSPFAGSLTSRCLGWLAAREYFRANPRYSIGLERRRLLWFTKEFIYGDFFYAPPKYSRNYDSLSVESPTLEHGGDLMTNELRLKNEVDKLAEKLFIERQMRKEMSAKIDRLNEKLMHAQKRYLAVITDQSIKESSEISRTSTRRIESIVGHDNELDIIEQDINAVNTLSEDYNMSVETATTTAVTPVEASDTVLQEKLQATIRKLKLEREMRTKDCEKIEILSDKFADIERKYRKLLEAGTSHSNSTGPDVMERIREIIVRPLDGEPVRQRIADYHAAIAKKGYDHVWRERMLLIQQVIESGETDLMRAMSIVRGREENRREMGLNSRRWVLNDRFIDLPWRPAAAAYRSAVFEAVLATARPQTTKIIETGSGWGEHLCNVFLNGGPYDATYYACELEEEGRKCALMLAALEPIFRLEARFFDYLEPDYSTIPIDDGHTILLTAHSVEQVSQIHEDCIRAALKLGKDVSGIHFEPIGWQTQPEDALSEVSQSHRTRCLELHYNQNLWPLLQKLQSEGLIRVLRCDTNMIGLDYNPATLITWEKVT